ncbi:MAG: hypothetical protein HYW14_02165 [Planctomycetes bacterium]|nr:hypothetical protein [Planctomycetota bacterium]
MRRQTYEVPSKDREIFIDPPPGRILELIHSNKSKFGKGVLQYAPIICGIPFRKFRSMVRREVLQKAIEYTKKITGNEQRATSDETIIQTGYQPTFYHPGIWLKNHLAYHIAKRVNGTSINISIDNDVCHEDWIYVPTPTHPSPLEGEDKVGGREITLEKIEFVERGANLAFEALSFGDANRIISFRDKVLACLNRSVSGGSETFEKFANLMIDASIRLRRTNIGEILTIARRKFEDSFGIYNLEVPVSKICECDSFLIFFLAILSDCRRFASIYNCTLGFYRKAHKPPQAERTINTLI